MNTEKAVYKGVGGQWVPLDAYERQNGAWVKISTAADFEVFTLKDDLILVGVDNTIYTVEKE